MKRLLIAILFIPVALCAQSPFDGTWVINSDSAQLPEKPEVYVLSEGTFCCFSGVSKVKADGHDHKVAASAYADTESIRVVDAHTVEVISKKDERVMYTETYAVSADANTLTKMSKDTTEAEAVTVETIYLWKLAPNRNQGIDPIHFRHLQVHQSNIRTVQPELFNRLASV